MVGIEHRVLFSEEKAALAHPVAVDEFEQKSNRDKLFDELSATFGCNEQKPTQAAKALLTKLRAKIETYIVSSKEKHLIDDFQKGFPTIIREFILSPGCQSLIKDERRFNLAKEIGSLYVMAYVLDMFESFEVLALKAGEYQKDQKANFSYMQYTCMLVAEQFDGLKTSTKNFTQIAEQEAKTYKRKLQAEQKKFLERCQNTLTDIQGKQESIKLDIKNFAQEIKNETNPQVAENKKKKLIEKLEELKKEINETKLPEIQKAESIITQPKIEDDFNCVVQASKSFYDNDIKSIQKYHDAFAQLKRFGFDPKPFYILNQLIFTKENVVKFREGVEKLKPSVFEAFNQTWLASGQAVIDFWNSRQSHFDELFKSLLKKVQPGCFQSAVSEKLKEVNIAVNEAAVQSGTSLEALKKFCLNLGNEDTESHPETKELETKSSTAGFFNFFAHAAAPQKQQTKKQAVVADLKDIDSLQVLEEKSEDLMREAVGTHHDYKVKIKKFNELYFEDCSEAVTQLDMAREPVVEQIQAEIDTLQKLDVETIIEGNRQRRATLSYPMQKLKAKSDSSRQQGKEEKAPLLSIKSQDSSAEAAPEEMPSPTHDDSFKLPRAKRYGIPSVLSGITAIATTIAAICFVISNPAGWVAGLFGAAVALIACAVALGVKAYNLKQRNKLLKSHWPWQQKRLIDEDKKLEQLGMPEPLREHMMKNKIVFDTKKRESKEHIDQAVEVERTGHIPCTLLGRADIPLYYLAKQNRFFLIYREEKEGVKHEDVTEKSAFELEHAYLPRQQI